MKLNTISKPFFNPEQIAAALAEAPDVAVEDTDNPRTQPGDWDNAVTSQSLSELRDKMVTRRRGPQKRPTKVPTTIRFDPEVLNAIKATGRGWQTLVNATMREWMLKGAR